MKKLVYLLITLLLTACGHQTQYTPAPQSNYFEHVDSAAEQNTILSHVEDYIDDQQYTAALQLLNTLPDNTSNRALLAHSQIDLQIGMPQAALTWLKQINPQSLNKKQLQQYYELLTTTNYRNDKPLGDALVRMKLPRSIELEDNTTTIWDNLQVSSLHFINQFSRQYKDPAINSWLELALYRTYDSNNNSIMQINLNKWKNLYPDSPANQLLPKKVNIKSNPPQNIAILLPLSGQYAGLGQAVQQGILTAQYQTHDQAKLHFYDTAQFDNMKQLYTKLIDDNNDAVIGPLTKSNVDAFNAVGSDIPTLMLNYTDDKTNKNTYEFGLSPINEAKQVASLAWRKGQSKALIITPSDDRSGQIALSFEKQWTQLGGTVTKKLIYTDSKSLPEDLAKLAGITDSKWREYTLSKTLGEKLQFVARRREDFDMIFLVASPASGREVKPLLKFNYITNIPVYSTSTIYSGYPNSNADQDLDGVVFCDSNWLVHPTDKMKQQISQLKQLWNNDFTQYTRLYALGFDSYELMMNLNRMTTLPNFPWTGATGNISLANHQFTRQLPCARFIKGVPENIVL